MHNDIGAQVSAWIAKGGIPLEYEAARTLAGVAFEVVQGRGYPTANDSVSVIREIDVLASLRAMEANVSLVVECKHTVDKPWVVLTNARTLGPQETLESVVAQDLAVTSFVSALINSEGKGLPPFFGEHDNPGFSAIVAFEDPRKKPVDPAEWNPARNAMAQAVGAANGILAAGGSEIWSLVWPTVLIDGPLFALHFDPAGGEHLTAVAWKRVLWYASPYGRPVAVDIVTSSDFARYADTAYWGLKAAMTRLSEDREIYYRHENMSRYGRRPLHDWVRAGRAEALDA